MAQAIEVSQSAMTASGERIAVWADDLGPWLGNPLLIDIKARTTEQSHIRAAIEELSRRLTAVGASWGLLIHDAPAAAVGDTADGSEVLTISAEDFLRALKDRSFAEVVRQLRNDRVHGRR